jgi:hypothetical protein
MQGLGSAGGGALGFQRGCYAAFISHSETNRQPGFAGRPIRQTVNSKYCGKVSSTFLQEWN